MFQWETQKERLLRLSKISPEKKMEWLRQMHELIVRASSKKDKALRWNLRMQRQVCK